MSNSRLINNIEALSITLSDKQLVQFLDIMDAMTVMVDKAKKQKAISLFQQAEISPQELMTEFEAVTDCKYLH